MMEVMNNLAATVYERYNIEEESLSISKIHRRPTIRGNLDYG